MARGSIQTIRDHNPLIEDDGAIRPLTKRSFTIDTGKEKIEVEGHEHKNVAVKYLMKRRRSLLSTKDPDEGRTSLYRAPGSG